MSGVRAAFVALHVKVLWNDAIVNLSSGSHRKSAGQGRGRRTQLTSIYANNPAYHRGPGIGTFVHSKFVLGNSDILTMTMGSLLLPGRPRKQTRSHDGSYCQSLKDPVHRPGVLLQR